jgi:hypothetical protein
MTATLQQRFRALEDALCAQPRRRLCSDVGWARDVSPLAGVYAIWDARSGEPVYVGETSGVLARMGDLGRTVNHTFRRMSRKKLEAATATESALSAMLADRFEIAFLPVDFGRAEFEEYLVLRWRRTLYNKPALRLQKSAQYQWVRMAG